MRAAQQRLSDGNRPRSSNSVEREMKENSPQAKLIALCSGFQSFISIECDIGEEVEQKHRQSPPPPRPLPLDLQSGCFHSLASSLFRTRRERALGGGRNSRSVRLGSADIARSLTLTGEVKGHLPTASVHRTDLVVPSSPSSPPRHSHMSIVITSGTQANLRSFPVETCPSSVV